MCEEAIDYLAELARDFRPEKGGSREQVAAFVVCDIQRRITEKEFSERTELVVEANSPGDNDRPPTATCLPNFAAGEIQDQYDAMVGIMARHTDGRSKFIVTAKKWEKSNWGPEEKEEVLLTIPIAKEQTGAQILKRIREKH